MLPKMTAYRKDFDEMSFSIKHEELLQKYEIWPTKSATV